MRKIVVLLLTALFFTGCSFFTNTEPLGITQRVIFTLEDNSRAELITVDSWKTAVLRDDKGDAYSMKRESAADGIYLVDKNGVNIHFKEKEGVLEYKKGEAILVKVKDHVWLD
ncbi:MAG: hypothetical protein GX282_07890 [Campylobacteraceae bacterium]|nr:hypothetical protein [Campylobacteraceae bacterium]